MIKKRLITITAKSHKIVTLLSLIAVQSSHAVIPSSVVGESNGANMVLGLQSSVANNGMYLGEWRDQIAHKINPYYFSQLDNNKTFIDSIQYQSKPGYINELNRVTVPIFSQTFFNNLSESGEVYFSFATETVKVTPFVFNQIQVSSSNSAQFKKSNLQTQLIEQKFYTPSYIFSHGSSSLGVGAVLLQQRFLDDSFGLATFASSSSYQPYSDQSFVTTNRGTGYQLSFEQKLPVNMNLSFNYRSEIYLNEFDTLGRSYSDPGDFDIPRQYEMSLGFNLKGSSQLGFKAEKIAYNSINQTVHSGYSEDFLRVFNSPISPIFKLKDLTVYSVSFKQNINDQLFWNIDVTSRQQASATAAVFDRILKNDTASVSYKVGVSHINAFGKFDLFASFANKPILIGSTDFGRLSSTSLNSHIEGVVSWSYQF